MILIDYLIGFMEDNIEFLTFPKLISSLRGCTDYVGYPVGLCRDFLASNQPLIFIPALLIAKLVDPVLAFNLIVLGGTILNFFFAYRFFKKLFGRFIAVLLSTVFFFSPYLAYQSRSHFDLLQFWPVIWFLDTFFFSQSRHKAVFLGLLLTLITGISNYLGYFTVLFMVLYLTFCFLVRPNKALTLKLYYRNVIKGTVVFMLSSALFMAPYVKANFFMPRVRVEINTNEKAVNRPFEDFVTFSSRPWYYLLPSVDNPFLGRLSQNVLAKLADRGNYLTQNYFKAEHSASYLGWINLSLALVGVISLFRQKISLQMPALINYSALLMAIVGLIILTMPPSISLNGVTLYSPSYILFEIFPMFRVLTRMGVLILFLTLIFTGFGYLALVNLLVARNISRKVIQLTLLVLALFSMSEFFIPLKVTHVGTPPKVYTYLETTGLPKSPIVVYPYNKTNEAFFWMTAHKQPLINPRFYENKETGFVSEDFTKMLTTAGGLEVAQNMGAKYLVYFYEDGRNEDADFFATSPLLMQVDGFKEKDPVERQIGAFVRIIEAGSSVTNSAILYKFK